MLNLHPKLKFLQNLLFFMIHNEAQEMFTNWLKSSSKLTHWTKNIRSYQFVNFHCENKNSGVEIYKQSKLHCPSIRQQSH